VALDHSCQVQRHPHSERGLDCYSTPEVAVAALLKVEKLPHHLWEPCCGKGNIVRALRAAAHAVIASDIHDDYGFPLHFARDFLTESRMPIGCEAISSWRTRSSSRR
jgi:methylase of polypeptide subunit release factors